MKRYVLVLAPALAGALFGASLVAVLVKPADAESAPLTPKVAGEQAVEPIPGATTIPAPNSSPNWK